IQILYTCLIHPVEKGHHRNAVAYLLERFIALRCCKWIIGDSVIVIIKVYTEMQRWNIADIGTSYKSFCSGCFQLFKIVFLKSDTGVDVEFSAVEFKFIDKQNFSQV